MFGSDARLQITRYYALDDLAALTQSHQGVSANADAFNEKGALGLGLKAGPELW